MHHGRIPALLLQLILPLHLFLLLLLRYKRPLDPLSKRIKVPVLCLAVGRKGWVVERVGRVARVTPWPCLELDRVGVASGRGLLCRSCQGAVLGIVIFIILLVVIAVVAVIVVHCKPCPTA